MALLSIRDGRKECVCPEICSYKTSALTLPVEYCEIEWPWEEILDSITWPSMVRMEIHHSVSKYPILLAEVIIRK